MSSQRKGSGGFGTQRGEGGGDGDGKQSASTNIRRKMSGVGDALLQGFSNMSASMKSFVESVNKRLKALHAQFQDYKKKYDAAANDPELQKKIVLEAVDAAANVIIENAAAQAKQQGETFTPKDAENVRQSIRASVRMDGFTLAGLEQVVDDTVRASVQITKPEEEEDAVFGPNAKPFQAPPSVVQKPKPTVPTRPKGYEKLGSSGLPPPPLPPKSRESVRMPPINETATQVGDASVQKQEVVDTGGSSRQPTPSMKLSNMTGVPLDVIRARKGTLGGVQGDKKLEHVEPPAKSNPPLTGMAAMQAEMAKKKLTKTDGPKKHEAKPTTGGNDLQSILQKRLADKFSNVRENSRDRGDSNTSNPDW